jgi:hypothetical protein
MFDMFGLNPEEGEPALMALLRKYMEVVQAGDEEAIADTFTSVIGAIGQMMWPLTIEVGSEVKSVLHALGHTTEATNVCQVFLTMLPDFIQIEKQGVDETTQPKCLIVGARLHKKEDVTENLQAVIGTAVVAVLRGRNMSATMRDDGRIAIEGSMDHFGEHIEAEAAKFADEIEQELGQSADDTGERKWWT